jgi:riboflavin synthase
MFTGIVESPGVVKQVIFNGSNKTFWIESPISSQLKPDQSVSHSGVCLTVEEVAGSRHRVTAVDETLRKTNLDGWKEGTIVNLERCLKLNDRLDGHFVQGHVDATAVCKIRIEKNGSHEFTFQYPDQFAELLVEKGSVCINGISLTAFNVTKNQFTVTIIPYTYEHTDISTIAEGDRVNIEFDMIGKYILRRLSLSE